MPHYNGSTRESLGEYGGYQVYKLTDGVLEGYRKGKRFVSNATTVEGFLAQVPKVKAKKPKEPKESKPKVEEVKK